MRQHASEIDIGFSYATHSILILPRAHQSATSQYTIHHIEEMDGKLAFLDVQVTRSPDGLTTAIYQKSTHTDGYIPFHSHHHQRTTTGVLRCMFYRALQICSSASRGPELERLKEVFQANGFPKELVSSRKTLTSQPTPSSIPVPTGTNEDTLHSLNSWIE